MIDYYDTESLEFYEDDGDLDPYDAAFMLVYLAA